MKNAGVDILVTQRVETALGVTLSEQRGVRVRSLSHEVAAPGEVPEIDETGSATTQTGQAERLLAQTRARDFETLLGGVDRGASPTAPVAPSGRAAVRNPHGPEFESGPVQTPEASAQVHLSSGAIQSSRAALPMHALLDAQARAAADDSLMQSQSMVLSLIEGRNPALARLVRTPGMLAPVQRILLGVIDAMMGSGVFQSSLLADAHAGRLSYQAVGGYLAQVGEMSESAQASSSVQEDKPGKHGMRESQPQAALQILAPSQTQAALETIHSQIISVQCLLCPGVPVSLRFHRDEDPDQDDASTQRDKNHDMETEQSWACQAQLTLPRLGELRMAFSLSSRRTRVTISAKEPATYVALREALQSEGRQPGSYLAQVRLSHWKAEEDEHERREAPRQ